MQTEQMRIQKAKLPRGMSHPLRSSFLADALQKNGITLHTDLNHNPSGAFLDAYFWPPKPYAPQERLYVRAAAVPAAQASVARQHMEDIVIPELIVWILDIISRAPNSPVRREEQYFRRERPQVPQSA